MSEFKLTDPYGTAPSKPPFNQSVSTGVPWHNLPEYNMIFTLCDIIDYVSSNSPTAEKTDTGYKMSGKLNGAEYTLITDENYIPTQLKTDGQLPLTVNFHR